MLTDQRTDIIIENAVKSDIAKTELAMRFPKLRLPVRAQRHASMIAAYGMFPAVRQLDGWRSEVATKDGRHEQSRYSVMPDRQS